VGSLAAMHGEGGGVATEKGKNNCKEGREAFEGRSPRTFNSKRLEGGLGVVDEAALGRSGAGQQLYTLVQM
jgi:hypothetical protein